MSLFNQSKLVFTGFCHLLLVFPALNGFLLVFTGSNWCSAPQGYRNFYERYRGYDDRFYGRDYDYNRYRDYYRQYNREVGLKPGLNWG